MLMQDGALNVNPPTARLSYIISSAAAARIAILKNAMSTSQAENITMSAGGRYSLATVGARDVIDGATELVVRAIGEVPAAAVKEAGVFTLSDMGCADGGTSLGMVRAAIAAVRERFGGAAVTVVYTDQLRNDFNALVHMVRDIGGDGVHTLFSATSFYDAILPPASLHLGFSATAMHWLSGKPCDLATHVHAVGATGAEREKFAAQARADWQRILLRRAEELAPGGQLVLVVFCLDGQGRCLGNTGGVNMFARFNALWRRFVIDGTVTEGEYRAMTLPQFYRTAEEFRAPFEGGGAAARAGLQLLEMETRVVPCPFAADFKKHGDAGKFAEAYIPTLRTWSESVFYGALSAARAEGERREIVDNFYRAYGDEVRGNPAGHAMDYVHAYLRIQKTP